MSKGRPARQRGQIVIMTALMLIILIGAVGLALDSGLGYIVKAKLNAAVDAAGIAAARAVVQGNNQAEQEASARQAATNFFNANYPNGYFGSTPTLNPLGITFDQGKVTFDVSATAIVPVTFMRVLDFNLLTVGSEAQVVRKDLDLAFVMDTTDSMVAVAPQVKAAAVSFLEHFSQTTDRIALIHFAHGAVVDVPFKADQSRGFDRPAMTAKINAFSFNGFTNFSEGYWNARDQLNNHIAMARRSSLRVIVFFSDGSPNTFASYFQFKSAPAGCAYDGSTPGQYYVTGALQTAAAATGSPDGLWYFDRQTQALAGGCYRGTSIVGCTAATDCLTAAAIPAWYNPHDRLNENEFPVVTNTPRVVTNSTATTAIAYRNVNRASRNLPEAMAKKSRQEGIYVYTLGLGSHVQDLTGPDNEDGETLLKCMANTPDALARCRAPSEPVGTYCWAANEDYLKPCFSKLASEILRLTR
jgi:Flp pilus assembly protein TadG